MKQTISSPIRKLKLLLILPLIAGVFYAFAAPEYRFDTGTENNELKIAQYLISKEKCNIPFLSTYEKGDLESIKAELEEAGLKIEYTTLKFSEEGKLKQISATVKANTGTISFNSSDLQTTIPVFYTNPNGETGVYFQRTVVGKVTDESGKPLKNASVIISGKTIGTITDDNGNFMLKVTDDSPIVISYVGFETAKINPDFEKEMLITMKGATISIKLDDQISEARKKEQIDLNKSNVLVIVDGKETTKAEMEKINPDKIASIDVLKDKASAEKYGEKGKEGVILITLKPDDNSIATQTFKVQANSPLKFRTADGTEKQPLIVKNGVVSPDIQMDDINPQDIESINVLKGESATAKYGVKGNNGVLEITMKKPVDVFTMVEEMPQFPGGVEALKSYVTSTMKYPVIALENGIQGQVTVKFVVDKTGKVTNARIFSGVDPSLDKEALRIVNSMSEWTPGKQNGQSVDVAYEMPINFKLPANATRKQKLVAMSAPTKTPINQQAVDLTDQTRELIIVPNPTKDKATITLKGSDSTKKMEVNIYDRFGKLIKKESKKGPAFSLSFDKLANGSYFIVVNDGENQFTGQLVVNH